jgi:hypothetical protein
MSLNLAMDESPTYTDLLAAVALDFGRPIQYLEIGVSVGKNFYCVGKTIERSVLFGIDWESPSPVLESMLIEKGRVDTHLRQYRLGTNDIYYAIGDEFSFSTWQSLLGSRFDVIFSDACHRGEALIREYNILIELDLLNWSSFFLLWDDIPLSPDAHMRRAFPHICDDLGRRVGSLALHHGIVRINGWLGQHEPQHNVGFATNLNLAEPMLSQLLAKLE